ncbi:M23 family metallopeptidase [Paracoccus hibiscisoli]|uniref:M23 family metallopeptidase n=1 Tax=Paracoccus hibiscisoli TaxID=2023261 RepID=A0A4U0RBS3_9RHOB|nr:M23 family metallopeptidase [Paracoccus hibiscisoli]TJZ85624.1 M23 family metallopeptidase [Paracoccus hibiscisoli]
MTAVSSKLAPGAVCQLPDRIPDVMILRTLLTVGAVAVTIPLHAQTLAEPMISNDVIATMVQHEVAPGDTLDAILSHAGIGASIRNEAALAISDVFDLSTLSPGQILRWSVAADDPSRLDRLSLLSLDGTDIVLDFSKPLAASLRKTEILLRDRRETLVLDGSLYDALAVRDAPESFAVELAALLAGQIDFRRDLQGGERLALIWQEKALSDGTVMGEPQLAYARLELGENIYEIVAGSLEQPYSLFRNGAPVQHTVRPVAGARLSSVFGKRRHPVLGAQRMHTGVDYAAKTGTPVKVTGDGNVVFAGSMRGYGRTIDVDHGGGVVTRYAHLSQFADGISPGAALKAGDRIGDVGATGLVSGPNLHYEVRVDGEPTDPIKKTLTSETVTARPADRVILAAARLTTGYYLRTNPDARS